MALFYTPPFKDATSLQMEFTCLMFKHFDVTTVDISNNNVICNALLEIASLLI